MDKASAFFGPIPFKTVSGVERDSTLSCKRYNSLRYVYVTVFDRFAGIEIEK